MSMFVVILKATVEILVLASFFYMILRVLRGSRGMRMLVTIIGILIFLQFSARYLGLQTLGWLCTQIFFYLPFFLAVVFQAEIRRVLVMMNVSKLRYIKTQENIDGGRDQKLTLILMPILTHLSKNHTGALIAVEQEVGLQGICETGKFLNAPLDKDNSLLETIFYEGTPLHDGGVVIRGETIVAASCVFPLCDTDDEKKDPRWGMRHQAALGLSEQSDAVVLVVSEETGRISLAYNGKMTEIGSNEELMRKSLNQNLHVVTAEENYPMLMEMYHFFANMGQQIRRNLGLMKKHKSEQG
ncbi:MAG: diadenylate cyclase [Victivallales bacterium]|nr:diadenylate cyclase [Victivallales bacterium]